MKQLTKKQKIDFCKWYLERYKNSKDISVFNFWICIELSREYRLINSLNFNYCESSEFPYQIFKELNWFNPKKDNNWFHEIVYNNERSYKSNNLLRLTIIAFVLAILESE